MTLSGDDNYDPTEDDINNPCGVCNKIYDGIKSMIQCSACKEWNHHECVRNPKAKEKEWWACPKCVASGKGTGTTQKTKEATNTANVQHHLEENLSLSKKITDLEKLVASQQTLLRELIKERNELEENKIQRLRKGNRNEDSLVGKSGKNNKQTSADEKKSNEERRHTNKKRYSKYFDSSESDSDEADADEEMHTQSKNSAKHLSKYIAQQEMRELPAFDGSPIQWPVFYNTYMESRKLFSDVANRNRLQKALKGKALKAVAGLLLSPSTVDDAVCMLEYRFGQSEQIIQEAVDQALAADQPNERKPESIVDYAMLVLTIKVNIEAVGDEAEMMNPMLIRSLVQRLPYELQKKWNRKKRDCNEQGKIVKVSTFSKWLLYESQDYIGMINSNKDPKENKRSVHLHHYSEETEKAPDQNSTHRVCFKCSNEDHQLCECTEFIEMTWPERKSFASKNNICFGCLRRGHRFQRCYWKKRGFHKLLKDPDNVLEAKKNETRANADTENEERAMTHHCKDERMLFKIIPVILHGPFSQLKTFALLDDCASVTLIEQDVANRLQLTGVPEPLLMEWTSDIKNLVKDSLKVQFDISGVGIHSQKFRIKNARTVKNLSLPCQNLDAEKLCRKYQYLEHADFADLTSAVPTILIGLDNANLIAPMDMKTDPEERGPIAVKTKLGWSVHGPEAHIREDRRVYPTFLICECRALDQDTHSLVEKYFSYEDFGVEIPKEPEDSAADKIARKIMKETTRRNDNGFEIGLLWRRHVTKMPYNYNMCLRRLNSIELKMQRNKKFSEDYRAKIVEYVNKGYARKLRQDEVTAIQENMWYLPHFGVSTVNKPKLRLVFDAKAEYAGVSLNSQLLSGPDSYTSLIGVLFRFRQGRYAVTADVREMFHQIKIRKEDQRFQCFLWRDGDRKKDPETYVMEVLIFGATCSPCIAQHIKNLNARDHDHQRAIDAIINRFYVDDYLDSFDSESEALEITQKVIEINRNGNFELRNIISNSKLVMERIPEKKEIRIINMNLERDALTEKVLGLHWDTEADEFLFKLNFELIQKGANTSKRELLRTVMSLFDPLGLLAHYVVRAKLILQEVWMRKIIEWDQPLPADLNDKWLIWNEGLKPIKNLRIQRNYSEVLLKASEIELHIFSDASERAYAAVAYARIKFHGKIYVVLISGKTKIASQKSNKILSMPRLELELVPVKRSLEKRWGVVYTCLTTRAIYIDLVPDLSADALILSIRNCNSRRGPIKHMYSDCGTNMKGARTELQEALNEITDMAIQRECVERDIEWHYTTHQPHLIWADVGSGWSGQSKVS